MAQSVGALSAGELVNKLTRFLAFVVLARELSLAEFGTVNVAVAAAGIVATASSLGLPEVGARDVAAGHGEPHEVAGEVAGGRLAVSAALALVLIAVALSGDALSLEVVVLIGAFALVLSGSGDWLLRGQGRMAPLAVATGLGGALVLAGMLLVLPGAASAGVALAVLVAGELAAVVGTWTASRLGRAPRLSLTRLRDRLRRSWPLGLSALIIYASYSNLDTLLLALLDSNEAAGLYSAPYRLFLAVNVIGTFAAYALLPHLSRAATQGDRSSAGRALGRALPILCLYGAVVVGTVVVAGTLLLETLFGGEFAAMRATLIVLCISVPWYSVLFPVGYSLIASDDNRRFLAGAATAGVCNVGLNLALIPPLGPEGSAVATLAGIVAGGLVWVRVAGLAAIVRPVLIPLVLITAAGCVAAVVGDAATPACAAVCAAVCLWLARAAAAPGPR